MGALKSSWNPTLWGAVITGFFVLGAAAVWQPGAIPREEVPMPCWWRQRLVIADLMMKAAGFGVVLLGVVIGILTLAERGKAFADGLEAEAALLLLLYVLVVARAFGGAILPHLWSEPPHGRHSPEVRLKIMLWAQWAVVVAGALPSLLSGALIAGVSLVLPLSAGYVVALTLLGEAYVRSQSWIRSKGRRRQIRHADELGLVAEPAILTFSGLTVNAPFYRLDRTKRRSRLSRPHPTPASLTSQRRPLRRPGSLYLDLNAKKGRLVVLANADAQQFVNEIRSVRHELLERGVSEDELPRVRLHQWIPPFRMELWASGDTNSMVYPRTRLADGFSPLGHVYDVSSLANDLIASDRVRDWRREVLLSWPRRCASGIAGPSRDRRSPTRSCWSSSQRRSGPRSRLEQRRHVRRAPRARGHSDREQATADALALGIGERGDSGGNPQGHDAMARDSHDMERAMSSLTPATKQATEKVLGGIDDEDVSARYPDRSHFVAADHAGHGEAVTRALFDGDPVVLVYPDGREILFTPEKARGMTALLLPLAVASWRRRSRSTADAVQLPPRTHIEARDSAGLPIAP